MKETSAALTMPGDERGFYYCSESLISHRMDALLGQLNSALATYEVSSFYLTQDGLIYFSEIYSIHNGTP